MSDMHIKHPAKAADREACANAAPPQPRETDRVTYFRVDAIDGSPQLIIREIVGESGAAPLFEVLDPLGQWRLNNAVIGFLYSSDAQEISVQEAENLRLKYFSLSLKEYEDRIRSDGER